MMVGVVQELELSIPWSNLKSSPAIIHLKVSHHAFSFMKKELS